VSQPLKDISDEESREPSRKHRFGYRKYCKCSLRECYCPLSQFSKAMQTERNAKITLCVLHDGSQVQSGSPIVQTTPTRRSRRNLLPVLDIPDPRANISMAGVRTAFPVARSDTRSHTDPPIVVTQVFLPVVPMIITSGPITTTSAQPTVSEVQILDVYSLSACRVSSSSMISCQQCKKNNLLCKTIRQKVSMSQKIVRHGLCG
jgi:hypothetical protein